MGTGMDKDAKTPIEEVLDLLDLEKIEENIFRGLSPKDRMQRVFGGQVLGQALVAALRTGARRGGAIQHGQQIFNMAASFQVPETGYEHQFDMPKVTPPEGLLSEHELR